MCLCCPQCESAFTCPAARLHLTSTSNEVRHRRLTQPVGGSERLTKPQTHLWQQNSRSASKYYSSHILFTPHNSNGGLCQRCRYGLCMLSIMTRSVLSLLHCLFVNFDHQLTASSITMSTALGGISIISVLDQTHPDNLRDCTLPILCLEPSISF